MLSAYISLGITYFFLSDYLTSIDYYLKAAVLAEKMGQPTQQIHPYMNIGLVYKRLGKYEEALEAYSKVDELTKDMGADVTRVNLLNNMGGLYDMLNDTAKARELFEASRDMAREIGYVRLEASALVNLGGIYQAQGERIKAMELFQQALQLYENSSNPDATAVIYAFQASTLLEASESELIIMGIPPHERLKEARRIGLLGLDAAETANSPERKKDILYTLGLLYEQQGQYKDALDAYREHISLRDSVIGEEKQTEVVRLEMEYEMGRRDAEAEARVQQHKTARNYLAAGGVLLLIAGGGAFYAYNKRRETIQKQRELEYKASLSNTEMKVLRLQLNPHFIFNSLNSISDYIGKNDTGSADYYLAKFAKLMRGILENSESKEIPLTDELAMLELYMALEAARLGGKFTYSVHIDEGIDPETVMVPPLILQPFVENSIWHGLAHKEGQGKITIAVTREAHLMNCIIEDNGVGRMKPHRASSGTKSSFGTRITQDRLDLLNRYKKTDASLKIVDLEPGTRVEVRLPLG